MEKYQTSGRLVIPRPCPFGSVRRKKSVTLRLFVLCVQGMRNGQHYNFFTF